MTNGHEIRYEQEPSAWRVPCPRWHGFDYLIFFSESEAQEAADDFREQEELAEDEEWPVEGLYAKLPAAVAPTNSRAPHGDEEAQ